MNKSNQIKYEKSLISKILLNLIKIFGLLFSLVVLLPVNKYYIWSCLLIIFSLWFMRKKYIDSSTKIERMKCFTKNIKNSKTYKEKRQHIESGNLYEKYQSWIRCRILSDTLLIVASIISIFNPETIEITSSCVFAAVFTTLLEKVYEKLGEIQSEKFKKNVFKFKSFR